MGAVVVPASSAAAGWGSWEELLLGGAVLRHGTRDWDVVAAELRTRFACTPELCRAKYEDLQQRYSGCKAWFDELRKQRMAELRRALEVSEGSIGSLESKIETLKAEKRKGDPSPAPSVKSEGSVEESVSKETSKDGLSAGSFTQETRSNWSLEPRLEPKPEPSTSPDNGKVVEEERPIGFLKGRRGKRKRKVCGKDGKEGSIEESADALGSLSMSARLKDNSTSTCGEAVARVSGGDEQCRGGGSSNEEPSVDDLVGIFDAIAENKCASVFRRRLDSQKRGRYKKMILQHVDVDTIRGKISKGSLLSAKELFRDLLLLANNALVFYSRTTREYKSANLLRDIVTKSLKAYISSRTGSATAAQVSTTPPAVVLDPPPPPPTNKKSPNACPVNKKAPSKVAKASPTTAKATTVAAKKPAGNVGCKTPTKESKASRTTAKTTTVAATKTAGNLGCKTPTKESKDSQATAKAVVSAAAKKPAGSVAGQQSAEEESSKRKGGPGRQKGGRTAEQQPEGGQSKGGRKRARVK